MKWTYVHNILKRTHLFCKEYNTYYASCSVFKLLLYDHSAFQWVYFMTLTYNYQFINWSFFIVKHILVHRHFLYYNTSRKKSQKKGKYLESISFIVKITWSFLKMQSIDNRRFHTLLTTAIAWGFKCYQHTLLDPGGPKHITTQKRSTGKIL